ncbi:MAG: DUF7680 family protein [Bacillota bacterium]|jgi:hypothetical protein
MDKQGINKTLTDRQNLARRLQALCSHSPWVLRITDLKDKPSPVFVVKERCNPNETLQSETKAKKPYLRDRGLLYGQSLRRCLPVLRQMVSGIIDEDGIPLELQQFLGNGRIEFRGNLPLDDEAGAKLSLLFKLQERVADMDRVELIAWRVERFSREEAHYWLTRAVLFGDAGSRWARSGMRIMLGGQPGDKTIQRMLTKLRK